MSLYTVTSIPLAAIPNVHEGTGTHQSSNWLVVPSSVPGSGKLQFVGNWVQVTAVLFQISANVVPNWFGVAIPNGIQDFSKANIFFHPMPAQAGYKDSDYPTKAGMWPQLFYYMERLGYQLDGAARNQIIIMPFLTNAATNTGIFLNNWLDLVTDILTAVRSALGADDGSTLQVSQVVVSSFSIGIVYSAYFRAHAPNLGTYMAEVWDFDGLFSSSPQLSKQLVSTAQYTAIKYDQNPASVPSSFHAPLPRWSNYVAAPQTPSDVHGLIRDFMFLHAASISTVGATISGGLSRTPSPDASGTTGTTGSTAGTPGGPVTPVTPAPTGATGTTGTTGTTGAMPEGPAMPAEVPPMQPGGYPLPPWPGTSPSAPQQVAPGSLGYPAPPFVPLFPTPLTPSAGPLQPSMPATPGTTPQIPHPACGCCCSAAITGIVSNVAGTAVTAITAIAGIASLDPKKR